MSIITYPRLYTSRLSADQDVVRSLGDATVAMLYELHVNRTVNTAGWTYRKQVLDTATRLFGDFAAWLSDQVRNPRVVGYNYQFLEDTLHFIRTGERELSVQNWLELVAEEDDFVKSPVPVKDRPQTIKLRQGETTATLLQKWCAQPNGFEDLVCSLQLLFGHARTPRA